MGEEEKHLQKAIPEAVQAMIVDTLGGRIQVSWDKESAATPFGQLVFFVEFLEVTGLWQLPLSLDPENLPFQFLGGRSMFTGNCLAITGIAAPI
ncbi:hypothetical protein [Acidithiobacillus concretivorus]|uniref:Uncharacterized protein n=1 Tax=Acidithiobacillus concretivorus TaxID=3063952 RepID=A0ABS5ZRL0_9PROT|nr:hypothetical protein [Acidithiobacillus concretivorus]MBU2738782.1 hypothetical protein [Acidithiobacillus concretivorus]